MQRDEADRRNDISADGDHVEKFVDNGSAPEFFTSGLHDIEVMGSVTRFIFYLLKRASDGTFFREPTFSYIIPNECIGPAIALAIRKAGRSIIVPPAGEADDKDRLTLQ